MRSKSKKPDTLLAHAGRAPEKNFGVVNPPVYHASTILYPTVAEFEASGRNRYNQITYGRHGTPTSSALEEAVAALEGGHRAVAFCSGVAACFASILAFSKPAITSSCRFRLWAGARLLHRLPRALRRRDDVLRSADRRRNRGAIPAQHRARLSRKPGLAHLRGAGRAGHRRRSQGARRSGRCSTIPGASPLFLRPLALGVDV